MTARKRVRKGTRVQPRSWFAIRAIHPRSGSSLIFTGKVFSSSKPPKFFGSHAQAKGALRSLLKRHPETANYEMQVIQAPKQLKNPSGYETARARLVEKMDRAAEAYENFTGRPATHSTRFKNGKFPAGFELGKLEGVIYRANREGDDGNTVYRHDFKKSSQPLLIAANDGSQLDIVGGRYRVTERGIEDT